MALLKLIRSDGSEETRELSRSQPLTIGKQQFNDICVAENDVAPFHCRISWNKKAFEVTAATSNGVEVNSHQVAHMDLKSGDTIRVGSLDLVFEDEAAPIKPHRSPTAASETPSPSPPPPRKQAPKAEPAPKPVEEMSLYSGEIMTESQVQMEAYFAASEAKEEAKLKRDVARAEKAEQDEILQLRPVRPGEQDIFRSPLVLGLTLGGLVLLLVTGIFWFLIVREQAHKLYELANNDLTDGKYAQSVTSFEKFLSQYPGNSMHRQAERGLAKALIMREISGSSPAWKRGLDQLNDVIKDNRSSSDFAELHSTLFQCAEQIALGAAKSAEMARDPELLEISKEAQVLLERYADPAAPPVGAINRINDQRLKADRAIVKQKSFDSAMQAVDSAIAQRNPMAALSERERLIRRFPEFQTSGKVKESLQKAMDLERSVIVVDEKDQPAETKDDMPNSADSTLGVLLTRSRTDEVSQGRVVFVMAKDCCYAVDAVTGELIWRRILGADAPFFPVVSHGAQSSVLLFEVRKQALICCQLSSGKLIWRQPFKARAIGAPLIYEGQIYQAIEGNQLVRIDVDSGRISARVTLSQNLATTPALSRNGEFLLVPGQMSMIYSLAVKNSKNRPPLSVMAITFTDHAAGSIVAPPLTMGRLLLVCENDQADSANLRLWDASNPGETLKELASTRTRGQVRDLPVLRGNQLVVPSSGEQFAAFVVTDEAERAGIAANGQYRAGQTKDQIEVPIFLALGGDGQFWSAGSAFRKFEIAGGNIRMESNATAAGIASQPLQRIGDYFFVGRKSRYSDAVTFSTIEREKLIVPWRCILGDAPLEVRPTRDGGIFWVGESGSLYTLSKNKMGQGGIDLKSGTDLDLPPNITKPVRVTMLHDDRMIVAAGGEASQLLILNSVGQVTSKQPIEALPEAGPVLLDDGLVLPLPSRLKLISLAAGKKPVMDWIAPAGESEQHHWSHLVRVDGRELIAIDQSGVLTRVQLREGDVPHLAEVARVKLDRPVDLRPVQQGDLLYLADAGGTCRQLNMHSFDTDAERTLPAPIRNLWLLGSNLVAHAGDQNLYCLSEGKGLPDRWTFNLGSLEPVGPILSKSDMLWVACRNGIVLMLNPETGVEKRRVELPQSLSLGLRQVNDSVIAVASDGTIYRVE